MKLLPLFLLLSFSAFAQKKPALPGMPDLAALQKMSPAQLKTLQAKMQAQYSNQIKTMGAAAGAKIDDMRLPDFDLQPPPKDVGRLSLLPKQPPTLMQLADGLRASKKLLESVTPKPVLDEVKKIAESQTPAAQHNTAIAVFIAGQPAQALLISMHSVVASLDQPVAWNNLAAMFNMSGLEQKAIPILMNQLQQNPDNPILLNNMGQAYLGLGDMLSAEHYLVQCLALDPLNPEANRSMGAIRFFQKQFAEGVSYFEKELSVAHRRSTLALLKKQGKPIDLYKLRKSTGRIPGKNYFEEIELAKFTLPALPMLVDDEANAIIKAEGPLQSFSAESLFWGNAATEVNEAEARADGARPIGVYYDLVEELLDGLYKTYPPENLAILTYADIAQLKALKENYYAKVAEMKCPPDPPNATIPELKALAKKCCDKHAPVADAFMAEYNGFIQRKFNQVYPRWKGYINGLVNIVSLDPTLARRKMVYANVQAYFNFQIAAWQSAAFENKPIGGCDPTMTTAEADSIIASARALNLRCPRSVQVEVDLQFAKLKGDCDKFEVEFGKEIIVNFEKNFKTGTATLSTGFSESVRKYTDLKASGKLLGYISFDNNWDFADVGIKGKLEAGVNTETPFMDDLAKGSSWVIGGEAGFSLGLESGFKSYAKGKGILGEFQTLEYSSQQAPTPGKLKSFK